MNFYVTKCKILPGRLSELYNKPLKADVWDCKFIMEKHRKKKGTNQIESAQVYNPEFSFCKMCVVEERRIV